MNLFRLFVIAVCITALSTATQAQQVKPIFKKLVYAVYRPTLSNNKKTVRIQDYLEIDSNGMFRNIYIIYKDDYGNHLSYEGRMWDTIYRMPDSIIIKLNKVFNGSKKLADHMVTYKLKEGALWAGPFHFLTYTDDNNKMDNLVVVTPSFLDDELADLLNKFWHLPGARVKRNGNIYRNKPFEAEVSKYHYACKYAPQIVEPPKVMLLEN
jgi:hypothetical protein